MYCIKPTIISYTYCINDLDTNIISEMSKFEDDTELCHRAGNPDAMELQEDIKKFVASTNKRRMSFNVDKCSVMHIEHNNMQSNYNMSNQHVGCCNSRPYVRLHM